MDLDLTHSKVLETSIFLLLFLVPSEAKHFYEKAESFGRKITEIAMKTMSITFFVVFFAFPICSGLYNLAVGNYDTTTWNHFLNVE